MFPRRGLLLLFLAIISLGCRVEMEGTGPGKRPQSLALRPSDELKLGRQAFREVLKNVQFVQEGAEFERVRAVIQRIARATEIEPLQREINLQISPGQFEWEYAIIKDDRVNAFCLPGGKIVVFSGLMHLVKNDDQLATVLSHEVAHALAHHTSERIAREQSIRNPLVNLAYNREQESEADHIGVFLMTFAGYDPDQSLAFWQQMLDDQNSRIRLPEILSDHPTDSHRIQRLQDWIENAKAGKTAFDSGRIAKP